MPTKMTLFFNQFASGFSETYYHPTDDAGQLAQDIPNSLYQKACSFRSISVILKAARFSRVSNDPNTLPTKQSFLIRPYPTAQGTRGTEEEPGADVVSTTAVYALHASNAAKRRVWVRGLWDGDVKRDIFGNDIQTAGLDSDTDKYFSALKGFGFTIRWLVRPPTDGLVWLQVAQVNHLLTTQADRCHFVNSNAAPQYEAGDWLSFNGIPASLPGFPRSTQIISVTTVDGVRNYAIAYRLPGGVTVIPKSLKSTMLKYTASTIFTKIFERFGEHKTGRPFGSLRGRSRAVAVSR